MARKNSTGSQDSSKVWSVFSLASALAGAAVAKKVLNTSWKAATGKEPPANPADPDVAMAEAVARAAASGTIVALARMLATRRAAGYYQRSTGHLPPQLQADSPRTLVAPKR
jgi:subtilisin family serine protease